MTMPDLPFAPVFVTTLAVIVMVLSAGCVTNPAPPVDAELRGTLEALEGLVASQATDIAAQATMISYLATRGPEGLLRTPEPLPTPYYPVTGSVVLEDGRCCAGGIAGESIEITARFEASSPFGDVTHMRVHSGSGPQRGDQMPGTSAWEPFTDMRTLRTQVGLNWVGFFVSVQFRDDAGNLSPIVWDDISIEGMPPPTP